MAKRKSYPKPINMTAYPRKKFKKLSKGYCKYKGIKSESDFLCQLIESFFLPFPQHELDKFNQLAETP